MDDLTRSNPHKHLAARLTAGDHHPIVMKKNGVRHMRCHPDGQEKEILSLGLACSEIFSGPNLYRLLKPGFDYEARVMEELKNGSYAKPLSIHTSGGANPAMSEFLIAVERHLPWRDCDDWCVSLQIEGASAVWAAIDMCLQVLHLEQGNKKRIKVAVGGKSYHGPPSTSFGARTPMWEKTHQLVYPVPMAGEAFHEDEKVAEFSKFLEEHSSEIGVILFEPQLGSSQAGYPWPKNVLKRYIECARGHGVKIVCDEVMCGIGRHGQGSLFVSEAWELNPDAVTFGKSIGAGVYPISGAVLRNGRGALRAERGTVMQSHTYCGSSSRALMAATAVLNEVPSWLSVTGKLGEEMENIFNFFNKLSKGMLICHGMGLMWGGIFSYVGQNSDPDYRSRAVACFKKHAVDQAIVPYFVPVGGFMLSPVYDIDVSTIYEVGERLENAIRLTMEEMKWEPLKPSIDNSGAFSKLTKFAQSRYKKEVFDPVHPAPSLYRRIHFVRG